MCLPASLLIWRGCTEKACPASSLKTTRPLKFQPTSKPMCRCVTQPVCLKLKQFFLILFPFLYSFSFYVSYTLFSCECIRGTVTHGGCHALSLQQPVSLSWLCVGSCHWYSHYLVIPQQDMRSCIWAYVASALWGSSWIGHMTVHVMSCRLHGHWRGSLRTHSMMPWKLSC